ncbi:formate dehydrogenase subunit delta [Paraglaciecola aquimarina]|uniref:Formate dehydrogenase subunit delta n=1 Tax=Paraglaciecola algarum TaxID=3050085 RepID=A0ABS9D341_9ALTE|nr:formate dehydrogenase subunit delta [Paraglaciecola sp. G1-23]MCF2947301.1 formate dehydrogenase subunit delta [Paraglaciecola sp. G1-23]
MANEQLKQLIKMVNQIANNNSHQTKDESVALIFNHLKKFWALSMKQQIIEYAKQDNNELTPLAQKAVIQLAVAYN